MSWLDDVMKLMSNYDSKEIKATKERPSWDDYFMGLAFAISQRSLDSQTKHGTVLIDNWNHIIGTGYNSFPRGMKDELLPKTRPDKYAWMMHSEECALANTTTNIWNIPGGATAYITGQPCNRCAKLLWQSNVTKWILAKRQGTMLESDETRKDFNRLILDTKIQVEYIDINIDWLKAIVVT